MVVFRCTRKLLDRLDRPVEPATVRSTGLLGDWYATILATRPSWLLLLASERTRLPVILPAGPLATVAERFGLALTSVLRDLHIDASAIMREVATMDAVCFTTTQSRSILGTINDFSFQAQWILHDDPTLTLHQLSLKLAETPIQPLRDYPAGATQRVLSEHVVG
jgi:hypothetical protein